ncbi:MAG: hypothetical protein CMH52_13745 [Myxococcales bacterium]|nr:hypothetical protein [Myxococcales bacterium]
MNTRAVYMVALADDCRTAERTQSTGVHLVPVTWENVNDVAKVRGDATAQTMRQLLVDGALGVYVYMDGEFAGHFWGVHSGNEIKRMWGGVDYGPDEVLLCWGWVDHERRGLGLFQSLIGALVNRVRDEIGSIRIVADVPVDPLASLAAHRRMGFRLTGRLEYVRVLRKLVSRKEVPMDDSAAEPLLRHKSP